MGSPSVSVIVPVFNEVSHIRVTIEDLIDQVYDGSVEVVVADGGSTDGTREWLDGFAAVVPQVVVVDNPKRRQAYGLNIAAEAASGEVLVRADGHSRYSPDFVAASVRGLSELGGAIGGRMNPVGYDRFSRAVAAAMNSPLTMGPARFHHATEREAVDTVYLGAFYRTDFQEIGGLRSFPSGSSEDADFYYRWRRSGRKVHVDPAIESTYSPRNTPGRLWRQYWRYGQGKAEMLWLNGEFPSWRPFAPILLVSGLMVTLGVGLVGGRWLPLLVILASWLLVLAVAAISRSGGFLTVVAAGVMHLAYGLGGLWGLLRGPGPVRHLK